MSSAILVYVTFPNIEEARSVSAQLLELKLIACANILQPIESMYSWKGKGQSSPEIPVIFKSLESYFSEIEKAILKYHSYTCPCILSLKASAVGESYLAWIKESLESKAP